MKRKIVIPTKPSVSNECDRQPRERRRLGLRFELVTGEAVSGLR